MATTSSRLSKDGPLLLSASEDGVCISGSGDCGYSARTSGNRFNKPSIRPRNNGALLPSSGEYAFIGGADVILFVRMPISIEA